MPGFATPRIVCDVPFVGKRWVHQVAEYDREKGISYWTKNYRTGIEDEADALDRRYEYYDPAVPAARGGPALVARAGQGCLAVAEERDPTGAIGVGSCALGADPEGVGGKDPADGGRGGGL